MPFQVSPGVNVSEIDLTTVIPAVSSSIAGIGGLFRWGPIDEAQLVDSEDTLVRLYGRPTNHNAETFFTAASFLAYSNALYVSRGAVTDDETFVNGVGSAVANSGAVSNTVLLAAMVKNEDVYDDVTFDSSIKWVARYPGALGNSLKISVCDSATAYHSTLNLETGYDTEMANTEASVLVKWDLAIGNANGVVTAANTANTADDTDTLAVVTAIQGDLQVGDLIKIGNSSIGTQYLKIKSFGSLTSDAGTGVSTLPINFDRVNQLSSAVSANTTIERFWEFYNNVDGAPGQSTYVKENGNTAANDEIHVVVVDEDGEFTGIPGQILEVWERLSRATDGKNEDGGTNYVKNIINQSSSYVWWANDDTSVSATAALVSSSALTSPLTYSFYGGYDGAIESNLNSLSGVINAWRVFRDESKYDVSLLLGGKSVGGTHGEQLPNYIIDNIAEYRKDCVAFVSPDKADVVANAGEDEEVDVVQFRNALRSSSYGFLDSGYKYMYDKYNDVYRWVPLNGDMGGLCARTDWTNDPWWSPGGFNRGNLKNLIKLAWNPNKAERDELYKSNVNPVVSFPGEGTVLYGDKTLLTKPSAFDRINVRRLFIVLEKAISTSAKYLLFEFNDEFTRASFVSMVEPYLRTVQGRRGITDFRVICDSTNNTGEVIDRNEFVGDIYIKPARSINFIQLNFVAVRTGVEFSEVIGNF